jgi:hypothetical protein
VASLVSSPPNVRPAAPLSLAALSQVLLVAPPPIDEPAWHARLQREIDPSFPLNRTLALSGAYASRCVEVSSCAAVPLARHSLARPGCLLSGGAVCEPPRAHDCSQGMAAAAERRYTTRAAACVRAPAD